MIVVTPAAEPWYLRLVAAAVQQAGGDARQPVTGSSLLVSVATQSTALLCGGRTGPG